MNSLVEKKIIAEMACDSNFTYVVSDNSTFLSTEYKVLQSQTSNFVKCMKMLYNGKIQLYYLVSGWKPLSELLESLEVKSFLTILSNLLGCIIDVKSNGFLACQNIDISLERIYVNPTTYKVSLVYLPLKQRLYGDYAIFENELRAGLVRLISSTSSLNSSARMQQVSSDLSNGTLTLEDLRSRLRGSVGTGQRTDERRMDPPVSELIRGTSGGMRLIAMNAPSKVEIAVTKSSFVIGKSASAADGVVSFNQNISRRHCRIDSDGQQYMITDIGSTNGTKVNGIRLESNRPQLLNNGDVIRLADSDFQVVMG